MVSTPSLATRETILELTTEAIVFLLRILFLVVLYLFLLALMLTIQQDVGGAASEPTRGGSARLVVEEPGQTSLRPGGALVLEPVTRLGRSGRNTIVLDDSYVSSEHAVITQRDGTWWLADLQSTNGTFVNERRVDGEVALAPGDVVGIGDIRLRVAP